MVDQFAEVTGDREWIHADSVEAANDPSGAPLPTGSYSWRWCRRCKLLTTES